MNNEILHSIESISETLERFAKEIKEILQEISEQYGE